MISSVSEPGERTSGRRAIRNQAYHIRYVFAAKELAGESLAGQLFSSNTGLTCGLANNERPMITIFVHWVLLLGTTGIVIYCITMFIRYRGSDSWTLVSGKIEGYAKPTFDDGSMSVCYTTVKYSYSVDDHDYSGAWMTPFLRNLTALNEFLAAELPIGKTVDVRYNPRKANRSVLDDSPTVPPPEIVMKTDFTG
jgi:hypothetical protein